MFALGFGSQGATGCQIRKRYRLVPANCEARMEEENTQSVWCYAQASFIPVTDQVGGLQGNYTNHESITGYTLYYGIFIVTTKTKDNIFLKVYMKISNFNKMIDKYIWFFSKIMQGSVYQSWLCIILI